MPTKPEASRTFVSADGSIRCRKCHLHMDTCTCRKDHPLWIILRAAFR